MSFAQFALANELAIRFGFFLGVLTLIGTWEVLAPRRALTVSKPMRWASNLGLVALDTVLLRLLFPLAGGGHGRLLRGAWLGPAQSLCGARDWPCRWP